MLYEVITSMIFQEPMTSLNPVFRIGAQVDEVIALHSDELFPDVELFEKKLIGTKKKLSQEGKRLIKEHTIKMLDMVGIANSEGVYKMYPHELSGGMRQRIMIAMALACNPRLIRNNFV